MTDMPVYLNHASDRDLLKLDRGLSTAPGTVTLPLAVLVALGRQAQGSGRGRLVNAA